MVERLVEGLVGKRMDVRTIEWAICWKAWGRGRGGGVGMGHVGAGRRRELQRFEEKVNATSSLL